MQPETPATDRRVCNCPNGSSGRKHSNECYEREIARLERELKIQQGVNDLAYIPHRHLVEENDKLRARIAELETR